MHSRTGAPRVYLVTLISCCFLLSQFIAVSVDDVPDLWKASASVGLSYGATFGLLPVITIEWFGLHHFSAVRSFTISLYQSDLAHRTGDS